MKIMWSKRAIIDDADNIEFVLTRWSIQVVYDYEEKLAQTEKAILANPKIGQFVRKFGVYKMLIIPQLYMIYEIHGEEIRILRIWNNLQKPYW